MALEAADRDPVTRGARNRAAMKIKNLQISEVHGRTNADGQRGEPGHAAALLNAALTARLSEAELDQYLALAHESPTADAAALISKIRE